MSDLFRYHRQMLLPGLGEEGQRRLLASTALVVGCGALGTVIASTLARAGVGHLVIVDRDFVELTNLQRQILFDEDDAAAGLPKAEAARRKLAKINSQVKVTAIVDDLNHTNIEAILLGQAAGGEGKLCDVVLDGLDNFETRFLVNDAAVKHGVPYVYGGAVGTTGASFVVLPHTASAPGSEPGPSSTQARLGSDASGSPESAGRAAWELVGRATPCLRCVFEQAPPPGTGPTCETAGVLGPTVSIVASYQAGEALKILTGNYAAVSSTLLSVDSWANSVRQIDVRGAYEAGECPCCKKRQFDYLAGKLASSSTRLCGRGAVQLSPPVGGARVDLCRVAQRLRAYGSVSVNEFLLRAQITEGGKAYELTLFANGRALVKGTDEPAVARGIFAKYVGA